MPLALAHPRSDTERPIHGPTIGYPPTGNHGGSSYTGLPPPYTCGDLDVFVPRATPTSTDSVSSPMPIDPTFNVYQDRLSDLYHGVALWNPYPSKNVYNQVSIGDVGYLREGAFIRMFNVMLPWDHPSNRTLGHPEPYESLYCGPFANARSSHFGSVEYYSRCVSAGTNDGNMQARIPDE
jgi:hypothetical protein